MESIFNQKHCVDQDLFSVFQLNVRSIPKNLKALEMYMNNLDVCFTVVCVTETWLNNANVNTYELPGYLHILNLSLKQGVFPSELQIARVIPIYKGRDNMQINNYRPVSVLAFISKIFERIMYNRIIEFVNKHNILYKYQFGFREKHGTNTALIVLIDKISTAVSISNGDMVLGVFLDFSEAFDTVDHSILLNKLYKYGLRGVAHKWVFSYLYERQQFVSFNINKSKTFSIFCGVPQGSILGPLLFLLYVNDISQVSSILFPILYADDTNLFLQGKCLNTLIEKMNLELQNC